MSRIDLERIREWANAKLSAGQKRQCAEHQYWKLRETVDTILAKTNSITSQSVSLPPETPRRRAHLRLVWSKCSRDLPSAPSA
jgi:hypothetical protein